MAIDPNFNLTSNDYQDPTGGSQSPYGNIAGSGSSTGSMLGNIGNIAGPALALGVGAYDIFKGDPNSAPVNALTGEAGQLGSLGTSLTQEGQGLQSFLEQGTLPGPQQAQLELAQNAAKARLIQGAGSRGQNTNPMGNSGLTQDINSLGLQTEVEKGALEKQLFDAGNSLITQGNQALGMEVGIQEKLAAIDAQQQQDTTNAIMGFAKSLGSMDWSKIGSSIASLAPLAVAAL
jgi:hypothetical protein